MKLKLIIALSILIPVLIAGVTRVVPNFSESLRARAQSGKGGETPFGGMRIFNINCTCDTPNKLLVIQDYATNRILKLVYKPGISKIYDHQNPTGATYLLGTYTSNARCRIRVGKKCISLRPHGQLGTQPGTGTSQ